MIHKTVAVIEHPTAILTDLTLRSMNIYPLLSGMNSWKNSSLGAAF